MTTHRFPRLFRTAVLAGTLVFVLPFVSADAASATSVDDQRREVERIVDELDRLHTQADILAEDYAVAVDDKRRLDEEVVAAEQSVAAKEAELTALRGDLSEVAVRSFTGGGGDVLGPLFSDANSYSEALRRDQYSRMALSVGTSTTDDLDELIEDLAEDRADLESKRAEVEALTVQIAEQQRETEELTTEYGSRRKQAETRLGQLIEEEEQRRADQAWAQLQADLAAQSSSGGAATTSSGGGGATTSSGGTAGSTSSGGSAGSTSSGGGGTSSPAPAPSNVPAVSGLAGVAISAALGQQGVPYRYATSLPGTSFDCSGLTHYAWGSAGVYLPRNSRAQAAATPRIPAGAAQAGDLIFFYSPISHVGIYLGGGQMVHAPNTGSVVNVSGVSWNKVTAVGRPG